MKERGNWHKFILVMVAHRKAFKNITDWKLTGSWKDIDQVKIQNEPESLHRPSLTRLCTYPSNKCVPTINIRWYPPANYVSAVDTRLYPPSNKGVPPPNCVPTVDKGWCGTSWRSASGSSFCEFDPVSGIIVKARLREMKTWLRGRERKTLLSIKLENFIPKIVQEVRCNTLLTLKMYYLVSKEQVTLQPNIICLQH